MKKRLLLFTFIVALSTPLFAQVEAMETNYLGFLKLGFRVGPNMGTLFVDPEFTDLKASPRLGFNYIGVNKFDLSKRSSILYEGGLSTQGSIYEDADDIYKARMTYWNFSFQYMYQSELGLTFFAGPRYGYMLGGKFLEEDKVDETQTKYKASRVVTRGDWAGVAGLGWVFKDGTWLTVRYIHGVKNINQRPNNVSFFDSDQEVYNRVFQFSIGFLLDLNPTQDVEMSR